MVENIKETISNFSKSLEAEMADTTTKSPLVDGWYFSNVSTQMLMKISGNDVMYYPNITLDYPDLESTGNGTLTFGDFGPAHEEVKIASGGVETNNFLLEAFGGIMKFNGVHSQDGKKLYMYGMWNEVETLSWQSEDDLNKLRENRDDCQAPSLPSYIKVQPENPGKLVWLTGPPGAGKSTTAQLMGKDQGFVYFEADCSMAFVNPFLDPNVPNPTVAAFKQKPVKVIFR